MARRSVRASEAPSRIAVLAVALGLWVAALFLPAIAVPSGPTLSGLDALGRGWRAVDAGVYAWLANPLFLAAAVAFWLRGYALAGSLSGLGAVLALTSFAAADLAREAGAPAPAMALAAGFYLWLGAQFGLLVACWIWAFRSRYAAKP